MSSKMVYTINGKFLSKPIAGTPRFAMETVRELDLISREYELEIAVPKGKHLPCEFQTIPVIEVEPFDGILWEQFSLPLYAFRHRRTLVNLGNAAPLIKPDYLCILDMQPFSHPEFLTNKFVCWYKIMHSLNIPRAKKIMTISSFARSEILKYFDIDPCIPLIQMGWEHMDRIEADYSVFEKHSEFLTKPFLFSLSTLAPNKNFQWVIEAARLNQNIQFVIAGGINKRIFKELGLILPENVVMLGRISDEEAKALYSTCEAFLFPTLYEGFGIPPLEAVSCGAKIILSDTECMHEVYGNHAAYVNPYDFHVDLQELMRKCPDSGGALLETYTWAHAAKALDVCLSNSGKSF